MAKYFHSRRNSSSFEPSEPSENRAKDKHQEELWALVDELTAEKPSVVPTSEDESADELSGARLFVEEEIPAVGTESVSEEDDAEELALPMGGPAVVVVRTEDDAPEETEEPPFPTSDPAGTVLAAKQPPKKRRVWPLVVVAVVVAFLTAVGLFAYNGGIELLQGRFSSSSTTTAAPTTTTSRVTTRTTPILRDETVLPSPLRAGFFEPDEPLYSEAAWTQAIGDTLEQLAEWNFNTMIVPLKTDGTTWYVDVEGEVPEGFDPLKEILTAAKVRSVSVMAMLDIGIEDGIVDPSNTEKINALVRASSQLAENEIDGFMLTGYRRAVGTKATDKTVTDITVTLTAVKTALKEGGKAIRQVGIVASPLWATANDRDTGLSTRADIFADLTDGYADTRDWVLHNVVDFVMLRNDRATTDEELSFEEVLTWWGELCEQSKVTLYTLHASDLIGSDTAGWENEDELALQCTACQKVQCWKGCAVTSMATLSENEEALGAFLRRLSNEPDEDEEEEDVSRTLTFFSPTETQISTTASVVSFQGSADPDFPLWLNGEEIALSEQGLFGIDCTLEAGDNYFTFEHKGKTVVFEVFYEIEVLRSVAPERDLYLSGGTAISVSAIAYKDAVVSVRIGDVELPMTLSPLQNEEDGREEDQDYENFSCSFTLPESTDEEQSLGYITVFASYGEQLDALQGGSLVVKAKPPQPTTTTAAPTTTTTANSADGSDEPSADTTNTTTTVASQPDASQEVLAEGTLIRITEDYAETFNGATVEDYSRPFNAYMPQGTLDVLVNEVYDSASDREYYLLGCGRRVYKSAAAEGEYGTLLSNRLTDEGVAVEDGYTVLTLGAQWKVPYQLQLLPQGYPRSGEDYPLYDITSMTATHVDITFYYTVGVIGTPDMSDSPLFSSAEWIEGEGNTQLLRLSLRQTGGFYGYFVEWTEDNRLVLKFRHPTYVGDNDAETPLAGMTIVVDAGHGGEDGGATGNLPTKTVYEKNLNLSYALELRAQLEALGATVVMTRTEDYNLAAHEITTISRATQPDLFISVHMNSYYQSSPNGPSVHYFNEYSYALADAIFEEAYAVYSAEKTTQSRGARWDPFYVTRVHDCPSVLIECGFVSNSQDLVLLCDSDFCKRLCAAFARGVTAYAQALPQL